MIKKLKENGFFHIFGTKALTQIIAFGSGILLVRILSKSDYGIYSYAISLLSLFLIFNGLGSLSGMLQFGSEQQIKNPQISSAYYRYGFKMGIIFDVVLALIMVLCSLLFDTAIKGANVVLLTMAALPLAVFIIESFKIYLRANQKNKIFSYVNLITSIMIFASTISGAILFNLYGVVLFKYIGYTISIILAIKLSKAIANTKNTDYRLSKT